MALHVHIHRHRPAEDAGTSHLHLRRRADAGTSEGGHKGWLERQRAATQPNAPVESRLVKKTPHGHVHIERDPNGSTWVAVRHPKTGAILGQAPMRGSKPTAKDRR